MNESTQTPPGTSPGTPSTTPAATSSPSDIEARIRGAMESPAYLNKDDARHDAAVQLVRELHLERDPDPDTEKVLPPVSEARELAGVVMGELPSQIAETWDSEAESDFLTTMVQEGIPSRAVQAIVDRYQEWLVLGGRFDTGIRDGDEQDWRGFLKEQGLSDQLTDRVVKWYLAHTK